MSNFKPLEVVDLRSKTQLQLVENLNILTYQEGGGAKHKNNIAVFSMYYKVKQIQSQIRKMRVCNNFAYNSYYYYRFLNDSCRDVDKIQQGIGDKLANFFQWGTCCIAGIAIGFAYGWKLTLVILAVGPALALCGALMGWVSYSKK